MRIAELGRRGGGGEDYSNTSSVISSARDIIVFINLGTGGMLPRKFSIYQHLKLFLLRPNFQGWGEAYH